jgi:hypothetical protein
MTTLALAAILPEAQVQVIMAGAMVVVILRWLIPVLMVGHHYCKVECSRTCGTSRTCRTYRSYGSYWSTRTRRHRVSGVVYFAMKPPDWRAHSSA